MEIHNYPRCRQLGASVGNESSQMKKASVNGLPALLHSELPRFSYLPGFSSYMEIDSLGLVSAVNDRGEIIGLCWQPIVEGDRVQVEQDLCLA